MIKLRCLLVSMLAKIFKPVVLHIIDHEIRVWGDKSRVELASTSHVVNTLFNTISGKIVVGEYSFTGHNVSLLTGTHQYKLKMKERMLEFPLENRDIIIGKGVWIGSNAVVIGPCHIGDNAVVAAGSIVVASVPEGAVVAGIPAKVIQFIDFDKSS